MLCQRILEFPAFHCKHLLSVLPQPTHEVLSIVLFFFLSIVLYQVLETSIPQFFQDYNKSAGMRVKRGRHVTLMSQAP